MKDLKIYYQTKNGKPVIDSSFDFLIAQLAKEYGLTFSGSGVEIEKGIRDIHYIKKGKKND